MSCRWVKLVVIIRYTNYFLRLWPWTLILPFLPLQEVGKNWAVPSTVLSWRRSWHNPNEAALYIRFSDVLLDSGFYSSTLFTSNNCSWCSSTTAVSAASGKLSLGIYQCAMVCLTRIRVLEVCLPQWWQMLSLRSKPCVTKWFPQNWSILHRTLVSSQQNSLL